MKYREASKNNKIAPLPNWGAKDLKLGTLRAVIRQLGLDWQEFLNAKQAMRVIYDQVADTLTIIFAETLVADACPEG